MGKGARAVLLDNFLAEHHRQLLRSFVAHRLRSRYRGAALGVLWALVRPILTMLILALVARFFALQSEYDVPVAGFILVGLMPWLFTASAISGACAVLVQEANVIKKVFFPRPILPLSVVAAEGVHFVISLSILLPALYLWCGFLPDGWILLLPVVLLLHVAFIYAVSLLVALGNVYFRDVSAMLEAGLMAWFYLTPVFYSVAYVRDALGELLGPNMGLALYLANPMAGIVAGYRLALLNGAGLREGVTELPLETGAFVGALAWAALVALALLILAHRLYKTHDNKIADVL